MEKERYEIRTPRKRLLIGTIEIKNGKKVLAIQSRGKKDVIEMENLVETVQRFQEER